MLSKMPVKVLVVEDRKPIQETICEFLEFIFTAGSVVIDTALNGKEGLQQLLNKEFDLLITDIDMPQMDGATMIRKARESGHAPNHIFLVTARDDLKQDLLEELGIKAYFKKPMLLIEELRVAIEALED